VQAFAGAGAQLVSFKANHVLSNGTIDLEASYHSGAPVEYVFLRPSGAVEDPTVPVGARSKPDPFVRVSVTVSKPRYYSVRGDRGGYIKRRNRGMEASRWGSASQADAVPLPACGLDRLWQEARRLGAPADAVATVTYDKYGFAFEIPGTPTKLQFDANCQVKKPEVKKPEVRIRSLVDAQPIGVDSDGDGAEDLLWPTIRGEGPDSLQFVSLFDGKTFAERYRVGPFGTPEQAKTLFIAAAGKRFVVRDPKGEVHLFEQADGKLVADFTFPSGAGALCGPPATQTVVAVSIGKKVPLLINTATGVGKLGPLPAWCKTPEGYRRRISESYNGFGHSQAMFPENGGTWRARLQVPSGTSLVWALADDHDVVGKGCSMGSNDCQFLSFDVRGNLRYAGPKGFSLDAECDFAFGRVICRRDRVIFAIDAASGKALWRTPLPKDGGWLSWPGITATRVWAPQDPGGENRVYAIDAATGALLGAAGM
jgi:outer membrane protein assembly factor BamB